MTEIACESSGERRAKVGKGRHLRHQSALAMDADDTEE